jgi:hypothetical protein
MACARGICEVHSWMFQVVKSVISGFFDVFTSGTGHVRMGCAGREIMRESWARPGRKVRAPQAHRVAPRPCPPLESGAGTADRRRGWHRSGRQRRRDSQVAAKGEEDNEDGDDDDLQARGDARGWRGAGPTLQGRNTGSGPDFDMMGAAHGNPGRVWQRSGKPGC